MASIPQNRPLSLAGTKHVPSPGLVARTCGRPVLRPHDYAMHRSIAEYQNGGPSFLCRRKNRKPISTSLNQVQPGGFHTGKKDPGRNVSVLPDANERTYFGWSNTWYGVSTKTMDAIFSVSPQKAYVSIFFIRGTELPDPDSLLEGQERNCDTSTSIKPQT